MGGWVGGWVDGWAGGWVGVRRKVGGWLVELAKRDRGETFAPGWLAQSFRNCVRTLWVNLVREYFSIMSPLF